MVSTSELIAVLKHRAEGLGFDTTLLDTVMDRADYLDRLSRAEVEEFL